MAQIDALLTELASTSAFSSASVRASAPSGSRRKPREILRELYASATPSSASFITQIILKDLRPVLYPLKETHYSAQLLHYNSKAVCMLSKEQAMKVWDPTGKMAQAFRVRASLDEAADAFESPDAFVRPQVGVPIPVSTAIPELPTTCSPEIWKDPQMSEGPEYGECARRLPRFQESLGRDEVRR